MPESPDRTQPDETIFTVSAAWKAAYPQAHAGVLVMQGTANPPNHAELDRRKTVLEAELRGRYAGLDRTGLLHNPILTAYEEHYRRFKKTYHVQLQLESILFKGKSIPAVAALVEAMFMAEMDTLLLTAGHDLDALRLPLTLDVARGDERYILLRGDPQAPKAGDMLIRDREGIVSSIVYGPDQRTQINAETRNAVFTVYAPQGIGVEAIEEHLARIQTNVQIITPGAQVRLRQIYGAA